MRCLQQQAICLKNEKSFFYCEFFPIDCSGSGKNFLSRRGLSETEVGAKESGKEEKKRDHFTSHVLSSHHPFPASSSAYRSFGGNTFQDHHHCHRLLSITVSKTHVSKQIHTDILLRQSVK